MTQVRINLQLLSCLKFIGWGSRSCVHSRTKGSGLIFPAQVASSQTKGMRPSDHGRGHTSSLHLCCNLLPAYLIHPQSPIHLLLAASMGYFFILLFFHLCFSFTSKLISSSPSFCWLVRAQRREQAGS